MRFTLAAAAVFITCITDWLVIDSMREGSVPLSMSIFMLAGMTAIGSAGTLGILRE